MIAARNIGLWILSLLLSISLFSLVFGQLNGTASFVFIFRITSIFALPVACLYLPIVLAVRDAEEGRMRVIVGTGLLIGPVCIALWGLIQQVRGESSVWTGDGIGLGIVACLFLALVVGLLATMFYITGLKVTYRLTTSTR